jgi:shikimate dehydrogenase
MSELKKRVVLIGWPISHSLSPAMQNAAFAEVGLDWEYSLRPTKAEDLENVIEQLGSQNVVGGNFTMPHKQTIIPYLAAISDEARIIGAVNTFKIENGRMIGHNTDGTGFLNALRAAGNDPSGMRVVMLGAGGGARAAIFSLAQAGIERITIINRTVQRGIQLAEEMAMAFPACHFEFKPLNNETFYEVSTGKVNLLVNATSVGMEPDIDKSLWPVDLMLPQNAICYDLIYKPVKTRFLKIAEASGHETLNGLGMLVHQGVVGFNFWTGQNVPVETMETACLKALGRANA